jgi:hypothetical protein
LSHQTGTLETEAKQDKFLPSSSSSSSSSSFSQSRKRTQGLAFAGQALYHLNHIPSPRSFSSHFSSHTTRKCSSHSPSARFFFSSLCFHCFE